MKGPGVETWQVAPVAASYETLLIRISEAAYDVTIDLNSPNRLHAQGL